MPLSHPGKQHSHAIATPDLSDYYTGMSLLNSSGKKVEIVQHRLIEVGYKIPDSERGVASTGQQSRPCKFGLATLEAIKDFQKKHGIYPDGEPNGKTLRELFNYNPFFPFPSDNQDHFQWEWAGQPNSTDFGTFGLPISQDAHALPCWAHGLIEQMPIRKPAKDMTSSDDLLKSMFQHEVDPMSRNFHWPRGDSGVTLGPGFDLGGQSAEDVRRCLGLGGINLQLIGKMDKERLPKPDLITFLSSGKEKGGPLGLSGRDAQMWVDEYGISKSSPAAKLIKDIDETTQKKLQKLYLAKYEGYVKHDMKGKSLTQYEFDALVSLSVNFPAGLHKVAELLNDSRGTDKAMQYWLTAGTKNPSTAEGLTKRRSDEVELFIRGDYWK